MWMRRKLASVAGKDAFVTREFAGGQKSEEGALFDM